ncbi:amidohydrolase family protein [Kitasatospora sp. HPMI-4]|uniref:amidohydrolase family protein n=1 Tax=Kitasatospora sp. HPMI-4 TaxID=3448443 RepID=UPI003F1B0F45
MRLVDQHCHSVVRVELDPDGFASLITESDRPPAAGTTPFDSSIGMAVRRWCPPALGLPAHAPAADYLARRSELGPVEATARLLAAAALDACLVDTGLTAAAGHPLLPLADLAAAAGAEVREVVRIESIAERVDTTAAGWSGATRSALERAAAGAVALKSIAAYRCGLAVPPQPPEEAEVVRAAGAWLRGPRTRLTDPVLLARLLWTAVEVCAPLGLPVQVHTGFGDPDLRLHLADPALLADFIRAVEPSGVPLVLLHGYPYHRQAAWLAAVFPHVYADVGLTVSHTGARAAQVLGEVLELAPFGKVLFSTDGYGLPELFLVGAAQYRYSLARLLADWHTDGACSAADASRIEGMVSAGNARRLYRL